MRKHDFWKTKNFIKRKCGISLSRPNCINFWTKFVNRESGCQFVCVGEKDNSKTQRSNDMKFAVRPLHQNCSSVSTFEPKLSTESLSVRLSVGMNTTIQKRSNLKTGFGTWPLREKYRSVTT